MILLSQCGLPSAQTSVAGAGAFGMADAEAPDAVGEDGNRVGFSAEFEGLRSDATSQEQSESGSHSVKNRKQGKVSSRSDEVGSEPTPEDSDDTQEIISPFLTSDAIPEQRNCLALVPPTRIELTEGQAGTGLAHRASSSRTATASTVDSLVTGATAAKATSAPVMSDQTTAGTAAFLARLTPISKEAWTVEASTATTTTNTSPTETGDTAARNPLVTDRHVAFGAPEGKGIQITADTRSAEGRGMQAAETAPSGQRPQQGNTTAAATREATLLTNDRDTARAQSKTRYAEEYRNIVTAASAPSVIGSSKASDSQEAAPRQVDALREVAEVSKPDAPPQPVKNLSIQVQMGERGSANVLLTDRGNAVHLSVRAPDPALANQLRADLQGLETRLHQAGFRSEIWTPAAAESSNSQSHPDGESDAQQHTWHQDESNHSQQGYGRDRRQQNWRHQFDSVEEKSQWT